MRNAKLKRTNYFCKSWQVKWLFQLTKELKTIKCVWKRTWKSSKRASFSTNQMKDWLQPSCGVSMDSKSLNSILRCNYFTIGTMATHSKLLTGWPHSRKNFSMSQDILGRHSISNLQGMSLAETRSMTSISHLYGIKMRNGGPLESLGTTYSDKVFWKPLSSCHTYINIQCK